MAPALGVVLDKLLMQRLRSASLVVQLMVTVGLMLAFMGITQTIWKPNTGRSLPHFFESSSGVHVGRVMATWHRIITVALALAIAFILRALLYRTRLGIAMRAVVDNRSLAGLNGARPGVVSGASWALGCMTAAIAGILIAPETGMVVENLTLIIIIALAAAVIGQMKSLPWAFVGGHDRRTGQCLLCRSSWLSARTFPMPTMPSPGNHPDLALLFLPAGPPGDREACI